MAEGIANAVRHFVKEDCEVTLNVSELTEGKVVLESVKIEPASDVGMEGEEVLELLEEKVHEVFCMCQNKLEIPSGDITPELQLILDDRMEQLAAAIGSVLRYQLSLKEGCV